MSDQAIVQVRSRRFSLFFHLRSLLAPDVKGILIIRQDGNAILGSESFVRIIHLAFSIVVVQQHVHMTPLIRRSPSRVDTFAPIGVQIFHFFLWVWCVHGGKDLCWFFGWICDVTESEVAGIMKIYLSHPSPRRGEVQGIRPDLNVNVSLWSSISPNPFLLNEFVVFMLEMPSCSWGATSSLRKNNFEDLFWFLYVSNLQRFCLDCWFESLERYCMSISNTV